MKIDGGIVEEQIKKLDPTLVIYNRKDYQNEIHIYCERKYENRSNNYKKSSRHPFLW